MASNRLIEDVGRLLRLARDQVEELPNFNKARAPLTRQAENDVAPAEHFVPPVPSHLEIVTRNDVALLMQPSDPVVRNGDIALTTWGGLLLNNEDFSGFHRLVEQ